MFRLLTMRLLFALPILLAVLLMPALAVAQDDPNETPLGDIARNLRKKGSPSQPGQQVIDDDNLPQVMQQADSRHGFGSSLKFLMAGEGRGFQIAAPDVTCSLSFTANVKSLLSGQYSQMELPPSAVANLEGHATIEGDALTVPIINGTDWHVSEVAVALTVVRKSPPGDDSALDGSMAGDSFQQVRPEKKPDVTVIYRMRAATPPWARTVFSAPLDLDLASEDEWHWAIVGAKGYPPQNYSAGTPTKTDNHAALVQSPAPASLDVPSSPAALLPTGSQ
jgi:hypothetical protein